MATSDHVTDPLTEDVFPIYYSNNLVDWELTGHVFPAGGWPQFCDKNMWAPEIHNVNGRWKWTIYFNFHLLSNYFRYLAYFSCSAPNSRHSIGVAETTTHLTGP